MRKSILEDTNINNAFFFNRLTLQKQHFPFAFNVHSKSSQKMTARFQAGSSGIGRYFYSVSLFFFHQNTAKNLGQLPENVLIGDA